MNIQFIQSKDNPKIKHLRALVEQSSFRKKQQQTVLEGIHLLDSFLQSARQPNAIFTTEHSLNHAECQNLFKNVHCPIFILSEKIYASISPLGQTTALLSVIDLPKNHSSWHRQQDSLILDNIQDPGNVGTLLRSAAAVGIRQILTTQGTASLWSPKVLRASMGAHFSLNVIENVAYQDILTGFDIPLLATSSHRPTSIYQLDLTQNVAWILGNEGQGVHESLLQHAQAVTIPQPGGQESLNVAIAGSVCLFEMMRQRL